MAAWHHARAPSCLAWRARARRGIVLLFGCICCRQRMRVAPRASVAASGWRGVVNIVDDINSIIIINLFINVGDIHLIIISK